MKAVKLALTTAILISACMADVNPNHAGRQLADVRSLLTLSHVTPVKDSRFTPMYTQCTTFQPPRLIAGRASVEGSATKTVLVDVIVLGSGKVDAPFIVEGGDASLEEQLQRVLSGWRYQPAMCDGNPIDAEGRIHLQLESRTSSPKSELKKPTEY